MELDEFASLQLDKPLPDLRDEEQLKKHTLEINLEKKPIDRALHLLTKGDEIQKLSVIQSLPSLLATDTQSCMSRVVPKMQQSLATASTEFHIAASATFKTILEQRLVSHNVFSQTFLQSILNSLESRDSVICHAWLETLLDVIELLPVEVIRTQILPMTISKGQLSQSTYSRIECSRLLGKICTRFDSAMIQKEVLPTVHSLCQDVNSEVRASICLQLRFVAEGLGAESVKPALLPSLVELASDEESNVRYASVQTIVNLLPHLHEDTVKTIIVPLVKKLCENAIKSEDNVICMIAEEYGKLVLGLEHCLLTTEKTWFVKYFQQLAQMGIPSMKKETKSDLPFISSNPVENERYVECRRYCAYNLPAMFIFVSSSGDSVDTVLPTFTALASDPYYMVRRTVACGIHEIAKVLAQKNGRIKNDFVKLLKDDSEEVLQGLVPHIALTLESLTESQTIGTDRIDSSLMEIGRSLLKCEAEVAATHNWRLASMMYAQLEVLPKCFPSDFIYSYFVPMAFSRVMYGRAIPVRLAAGRLYLVFLRYNAKPMQRAELRNRMYNDLANHPNCYARMIFVRVMIEALAIFSSAYFKEHFFSTLLTLAEDSVANVRLKVVSLLPTLKSQLCVPTDKKLLTTLETTLRHLLNSEKDRDVMSLLASTVQKLDATDVKYDGQGIAAKLTKHDAEDARKLEEEKRLLGASTGKSPVGGFTQKRAAMTPSRGRPTIEPSAKSLLQPKGELSSSSVAPYDERKPNPMKYGTSTSRHSPEVLKTSTSISNVTSGWARFTPSRVQLTQPWERTVHTNSNISTTHIDSRLCNDYVVQKAQCNCSKLAVFEALLTLPSSCEQQYKGNTARCCSSHNAEPDHLNPRNQQVPPPDYSPHSNFAKSFLLTNLREHRQDSLQNFLLTRDHAREPLANNSPGGKDKAPDLAALRALTNAAHYNSCWAFSSMPEIPVTLSDDEFLVDAGIRIPAQLSTSQSTSKIPNLQDFIFGKRRTANADRSRRGSMNFDKDKPKRHSSVEYDDCTKRANGADQSSLRTSMDYEEGIRQRGMTKENLDDRQLSKVDSRVKRYSAPHARARFGFDANQGSSADDKLKRNSLILDKDKPKVVQSKCPLDRTKRHSASFATKPPDSKDAKQKFKRHSLEVTDYAPSERLGRVLRRYSTLDVNHNQGVSKIPLRSSVLSGSRTAPATRASSPVRWGSQLRFEENREDVQSSTTEGHLTRFSSSAEEVDKLCRMFLHSQTAPTSGTGSPRTRDSRLPIRLLRKKL